MKIIENLNSKESYLSAIHQARMFGYAVTLAEAGRPDFDFAEQIHEIAAFHQKIKEKSRQEVPQHLQNVHQILEELLDGLTKRVDILSKQAVVAASPSLAVPTLGSSIALATGLGLYYLWPVKREVQDPEVEVETSETEEKVTQDPLPEEPREGEVESSENEGEKVPDSEPQEPLPEEPQGPQGDENTEEVPSSVPIPKKGTSTDRIATIDFKAMGGHVRDLFMLLQIALAGHAINSAKPWMVLAGIHRVFHIARLSNVAPELTKTMPLFATEMERVANLFSQFEAGLPVSTSRILEGMTSLDRLALVGFLDFISKSGAVQGLSAIPGFSILGSDFAWNVIKFAPFIESGLPHRFLSNETAHDSLGSYVRDLSLLGQIFLASRAINNARSFLTFVAAHRFFHIVRLCNLTESLKEKMPLLVDGVEKAADAYSWVEETLPFSTSDMLERMTNLDSWAAVGFFDLVRNTAAVQAWTGGIPVLSTLLSDRAWSIVRFSPFLFGPIALSLTSFQVPGLG